MVFLRALWHRRNQHYKHCTVTGTGTGSYGILVSNLSNGTSITVNSAAVTSNRTGISVLNIGTGDTTITTTGLVSSTGSGKGSYEGYLCSKWSHCWYLTISTGAVSTNSDTAIFARNSGTGVTNITVNGAITGGAKGNAIVNQTINASTITLNSGASVTSKVLQ